MGNKLQRCVAPGGQAKSPQLPEAPPAAQAPTFAKRPTCVKVVGVGGCTRAGKSSISASLVQSLKNSSNPVRALCVDEFFGAWCLRPVTLASGTTTLDLENPASLDWKAFAKKADELVAELAAEARTGEFAVLVIEGYVLYHHSSVRDFCDVALFVNISKELCKQRRMSTKRVAEEYFEKLLWPSYERFGLAPPGAMHLDGAQPASELAERATSLVEGALAMSFATADGIGSDDADVVVTTGTAERTIPVPPRLLWRSHASASVSSCLPRRSRASATVKPPVVLILSGAFNPPHRMHMECLSATRAHLEQKHGMDVVLAYVVPSSDRYIRSKVERAGEDLRFALPLEQRCRLCKLAAESSSCADWAKVLNWGIMSGFDAARSVERAMGALGAPVQCLTVYGSDFFYEPLPACVCITRAGDEERLQKLLAEAEQKRGLPLDFYVISEQLEATSSTAVRDLWRAGDWEALRESTMLHPEVLQELRASASVEAPESHPA